MDEKVATWILEFLLRQPIDEKIINGVLSCLPLSNNDNRLKKTILLRKLESEIANGSISEKLLELFEIIEELDHREGKMASDSMKSAYCAVAVDCTLRFLEENVEKNGKYFETVERVWRNRVCLMEGLASEELNRWFGDIEAAIWDSEVCEKVLMRNTRNEALKAVKGYLKEAWKSMGPAFLELVATEVKDQVEELRCGRGSGGAVVGSDNPGLELVATQGMQKDQSVIRRKHVAVKNKCPRGAKISDSNEEDAEESLNAANDVPIHKVDKVQETLQTNSMHLHAAGGDSHPDAIQADHILSHRKDDDVPTHKLDKLQALQSRSLQLRASMSDSYPDASPAVTRVHASPEVTNNVNDVNVGKKGTRPVIHASPEVTRVPEALKSSARDLHAAVTDPLPEAPQISETVFSTAVTVTHNLETAVENQTGAETLAIREVNRVQQALETSSMEVHAAKKDLGLDASETVGNVSSKTVTQNHETVVENQTRAETHAILDMNRVVQQEVEISSKEVRTARKNRGPDASQTVADVSSKTATRNHEAAVENQTGVDTHANSELNRVQQELETSSTKMHATRKSLRRDASQTVENVSSKIAAMVSNDAVVANQTRPGIHATRKFTGNNPETVEKSDKHMGHAEGSDTHDPKEVPTRKRSLMEPNGTSHTYEWDDSIDNGSGGGLNVRLPSSSKRSRVAPLQPYEDKKFIVRRERKKWTPQEEDTLRDAVKKFGKRWAFILECYRDMFKDRTDVDLKDKWRNLLKYQS